MVPYTSLKAHKNERNLKKICHKSIGTEVQIVQKDVIISRLLY
ncbi:hypothetical protein VCHA53O466_40059 [Vibrio chagasii]|nr:hypothetical protein VCHA53O466_40059 [Vibrio chagasii]